MSDKILVLTVTEKATGHERTVRLHKRRAVIGSSTSADVQLEDANINPVHAIVEMSGPEGSPVVYDLASDTGVKINGQSIVQQNIQENDVIAIGDFEIKVKLRGIDEVTKKIAAPERIKESSGKQKLFVSDKVDLAPLILADEAGAEDIFDHSTESKQSLQVVMFYKDKILDVEHFVDKQKVVIGPGKKEDFSVPPILGNAAFDLVTNEGGQYVIHLHPTMKGMVNTAGKTSSIQDLSSASKRSIPLSSKDFAKVTMNDVSFFMNYTPAPPRLKRPRFFRSDIFFTKIWMTSLAMTGLLVFTMSRMEVSQTIEIEQIPERVATIIYEPKIPVVKQQRSEQESEQKIADKVKPPKKEITVSPTIQNKEPQKDIQIGDKSETKQTQKSDASNPNKKPAIAKKASGQEGAGAKARGEEGARGKQTAKRTGPPQDKAMRPGQGNPGAAATGQGQGEIPDLGVVDVFKTQKGTLDKVLAGGKGVSNAASKLEGYSGFTTKGEGGLGAAGTGTGGGGQSMGLGGLADKGIGGGKKGTGLGALGSGGNLLGGTGKLTIDSGGGGDPVVMGSIDKDAIAREIAKYADQFRYCYEKEINAQNPDLAGRVAVRFTIGPSGKVAAAGVSATSLNNQNTEKCVVDVFYRIQFPPVKGGGEVIANYSFVFKPSNR